MKIHGIVAIKGLSEVIMTIIIYNTTPPAKQLQKTTENARKKFTQPF